MDNILYDCLLWISLWCKTVSTIYECIFTNSKILVKLCSLILISMHNVLQVPSKSSSLMINILTFTVSVVSWRSHFVFVTHFLWSSRALSSLTWTNSWLTIFYGALVNILLVFVFSNWTLFSSSRVKSKYQIGEEKEWYKSSIFFSDRRCIKPGKLSQILFISHVRISAVQSKNAVCTFIKRSR